ncbi:hypothetical protein N7451_001691 [Penicillium sp. IBT 35674x]|nr:hypothetical protein N7451_001691 [Penicillium sp. IBT 35674x]
MPLLKVLICGGGIAGNALAFWLSKLGHQVTVIERHHELRATGLQIDLRGHGIEVLQKMGLEEKFRAHSIKEEGLGVVDSGGRQWAFFPANHSGRGLQSFSTDFEIMRGDLCRLLHDATEGRVKYVFETSIQTITEQPDSVEVVFSNGHYDCFDLVVGADGQRSRIRRLIMGPGEEDPFHSLGMYGGYFTIPREMQENEAYAATAYIAPGSRFLMIRRHDPLRIQAYMFCKFDPKRIEFSRGSPDRGKNALKDIFTGAGWESENILRALEVADDFYGDESGFIKMSYWSRGHVVLVGDAAYGSSGMTGMGTTSGLVGSYVLAGEISEAFGRCSEEVSAGKITTAFESYEAKFRPFINQVQGGLSDNNLTGWDWLLSKSITITICDFFLAVASYLRLDVIAQWFLREDIKNWDLPLYPNMLGA